MTQFDYIKEITRYGLENDRDKLLDAVNEFISYSKKIKKVNFAVQLQTILRDALNNKQESNLRISSSYTIAPDISDLILEKISSEYTLENIVAEESVKSQLSFFIEEHQKSELLAKYNLPISNKLLLHGPSGCGKTLASYVIAGELNKVMSVVNLGTVVSSKLGETSKNLAKIFRQAAVENSIIFLDEFDSLGKIRDYSQDHGEMKRVVNTILQLFDYLPQTSIVIAATNQKNALDEALLRRFDSNIGIEKPTEKKIKELIALTLSKGSFKLDKKVSQKTIIKNSLGLSYYSIQKTLINAIKKSLFAQEKPENQLGFSIDTNIWNSLIKDEKAALKQNELTD